QRAGDLPARLLGPVVLADPKEGAHDLQDGEERYRLSVRHPLRLVHGDAACPAALREVVAEPTLADARLGDHANHPPITGERALERRLKRRHLVVAPDEAREAPRAGDVEARAQRARAFELVDGQCGAAALEREPAEIAELEVPRYEGGRVLREVDAAGIGELLHALGESHRVAERRVVHAEIVADPPHDDLSRVEPHADGEAEAARAFELRGVAAQLA